MVNHHLMLEAFQAKENSWHFIAVKIVVLLSFMENNISNFQLF
jgi:hypothetical protein